MQLTVTCPPGGAPWLEKELAGLGLQASSISPAVVELPLSQRAALTVCLHSRLAERVLWPVAQLTCDPADAARNLARELELESLAKPGTAIHLVVEHDKKVTGDSRLTRKHLLRHLFPESQAGVWDQSSQSQRYPLSQDVNAGLCIRVRVEESQTLAFIDLTGEPLHRRGYRSSQREAPLRENIAALILHVAGWQSAPQNASLVDPFCGSGTIAIEAAMMAAGIPPGSLRSHFAFRHWAAFRPALWEQLQDQWQQEKVERQVTLKGFDSDKRAIAIARENAQRAGVDGRIHFEKRALGDIRPRDLGSARKTPQITADDGAPTDQYLVCNPPWGERLEDRDVAYWLHVALANLVAQQLPSARLALIGTDVRLLDSLGMRIDEHVRIRNGALKCFIRSGCNPAALSDTPALYAQPPSFELPEEAIPLANRLRKNAKKLQRWLSQSGVRAYRIYDRDLPEFNLAVDVYGDQLLVQEYEAPDSIDEKKAQQRLSLALTAVRAVFAAHREQVFLRKRRQQKGRGQYQRLQKNTSSLMDAKAVVEGHVRLLVNLKDYLDSGLFLDHRPMRERIYEESHHKRVLNLFAYTGSVSVHAAAAGAHKVVSVDASRKYLKWARANFAVNGLSLVPHEFVGADVLSWLEEHTERYDIVFCDPPTFSNSKSRRKDFVVQRDHAQLIHSVMRNVENGGVLYFSCNFRRFKLDEEIARLYQVEELTRESIPPDFQRNQRVHVCYAIRRR